MGHLGECGFDGAWAMCACQQKRVGWAFALQTLLLCGGAIWGMTPPSLRAAPIEFGLGLGLGQSSPNRFAHGMTLFHSQLNAQELGVVQGRPETFGAETELWVRVLDLFGPEHFLGFGIGNYNIPKTHLTEVRSDGEVINMDFHFRIQYALLKYDYSKHLSRAWDYEIGGGFGYLFGSRLTVSGYKVKGTNARTYVGSHRPEFGNIWRLGIGLKRPIHDNLILRFGVRLTQLQYGNFRGRLNDLDSSYYFTRDGGLTIVSALEAAEATTVVNDPVFGPVTAAQVRRKAWVSEGRTEFYTSIGVRF